MMTVSGWTSTLAWRWGTAGSRSSTVSPAGHQPMTSESGRYVIVFNGEIYNHRDVRQDLTRPGGAPVSAGTPIPRFCSRQSKLGVSTPSLQRFDRHVRVCALGSQDADAFTWCAIDMGEKPLYSRLVRRDAWSSRPS